MNKALAALGLAGLLGCATETPEIITHDRTDVRQVGAVRYEVHTLTERRIPGAFPGYELHAKFRPYQRDDPFWSELQVKAEFIGTRQEYAQIGLIENGHRVIMRDGRAGPYDGVPDEQEVDGIRVPIDLGARLEWGTFKRIAGMDELRAAMLEQKK